MRHICPVCGWDKLMEAPYDEKGGASYEGCPACGFETGYHDDPLAVGGESPELTRQEMTDLYRKRWIEAGMKWNSVADALNTKPVGWNPREKLRNIGVELA